LWKFMSKSLVGDRQCWTSAYPSSRSWHCGWNL
jgi:hypothetical protein